MVVVFVVVVGLFEIGFVVFVLAVAAVVVVVGVVVFIVTVVVASVVLSFRARGKIMGALPDPSQNPHRGGNEWERGSTWPLRAQHSKTQT